MRHTLYIRLHDGRPDAIHSALMALAEVGCSDFRDVWLMADTGTSSLPRGRVPFDYVLTLSADCRTLPRELSRRFSAVAAADPYTFVRQRGRLDAPPEAGSLVPVRRVDVGLAVRAAAWLRWQMS